MSNNNHTVAYFITYSTYGTRLHGDQRGATHRKVSDAYAPALTTQPVLHAHVKRHLHDDPLVLNYIDRQTVLEATINTCIRYAWKLYAVHVRSNHVHIVVKANCVPEKVMSQCKAFATRSLKLQNHYQRRKTFWTRHGSTRYLKSNLALWAAMNYVIDEQGKKMACYYDESYDALRFEL